MTYCLALRLDEGLVFLADTRTNAGVDNVGTYRKLHVLRPAPDRVFVLQSAGSLATTHEVLDRIERDLDDAGRPREPGHRRAPLRGGALRRPAQPRGRPVAPRRRSRRSAPTAPPRSSWAARSPARRPTSCSSTRRATTSARPTTARSCRSARASTASSCSSSPSRADVDLGDAVKIALGSMISTAHANLSVGPPYDLGDLPRPARSTWRRSGSRRTPRCSPSCGTCGSACSPRRSRSCRTSPGRS